MGKDILPLQFQFEKSAFQDFESAHPKLTRALKSWDIDESVRNETISISAQSPYNKAIVALYIAKYAPEGDRIKNFAVNAMRDFYTTLYDEENPIVPQHVREEIQDIIGDFLIDNKAAYNEFYAQTKAWDISESSWKRARHNAGDEDVGNMPDVG
ncbi:MAG: hypothetical protein ACRBCK_09255 [Alphaproteobacteria bacterium]